MNQRLLAALLSVVVACTNVYAQEFKKTPLPSTHPLIGLWRIDFPKIQCFEEYEVRADGTKSSMSGQERNESEFMMSLVPTAKGYYKWTDKIVQNNGKPDCSGSFTELGHVAVNYILLHPSGQRLYLCEAEFMNSCFAEFHQRKRSDV